MRHTALLPSKVMYVAPVLLCLLLVALSSYSQKKEPAIRKIYAQAGLGKSSMGGYLADWGTQVVFKNDITVSFSYLDINSTEKDGYYLTDVQEAGYSPSWFSLVNWIYLPEKVLTYNVTDYRATVYNLTGGRCFDLGRSVWATAELGASVVKVKEVYNEYLVGTWNQSPSGPDRNIDTDSKKFTGGGLILKADLNWAFSSFAGMGIGTFLGFNSTGYPAGLAGAELKLIVGKMNRKPKGTGRR